jgi:ferritin-like metal-binding protein YciE
MSPSSAPVAHYLREAHELELELVRTLQSQIAASSRGAHRTALEAHLEETRSHATRVRERLARLEGGEDAGVVRAGLGLVQGVAGQLLAFTRTPIDLVRGSGSEERVLRDARDACAAEAYEIATYATLERVARDAGDTTTATLAATIRRDEEAMLQRLLDGLDDLARAVTDAHAADADGDGDRAAHGARDADADRDAQADRDAHGDRAAHGDRDADARPDPAATARPVSA